MSNRVIIDQTVNTVTTDQCPTIHNSVVVNNDTPSIIGVTENVTNIVTVAVPGPQGPAGPAGPSGSSILNQITSGSVTASVNIGPTIFSIVSGSSTYLTVSSSGNLSVNGNTTITGSLTATQGITGSLFGTASWALNAITASYVPASAVVGLNLSQISTGSVSASVSLGSGSFELVSGSTSFLFVSSSGNVGIGTTNPTAKLQVNNSVVGDSLKINGASNTSLTFNTDAFGRAFIGVSGNTLATSTAGAYFTADGYQEAWFNVVSRIASSGNKYWRFGNLGSSNYFAIQKLNDAADTIAATPLTIFSSTGNVLLQGLGTSTTDSTQRLQVIGDAFIKGSGNTSATTALLTQNSSGTETFLVRNDAAVKIGSGSFGHPANTRFQVNDISGNTILRLDNALLYSPNITNSGTSGLTISGNQFLLLQPANPNNGNVIIGGNITNTVAYTNDTRDFVFLNQNWNAVVGTSNIIRNALTLNNTINYTNATGTNIARGLYVNPVLTSVSDWRSIEWTNNASGSTSWGLYGSGSAPNYLSGSLNIGTTSIGTNALNVNGNTLLRGSGNTSVTNALTVNNSSGTQLMRIQNDGATSIGAGNQGLSTINLNIAGAFSYLICTPASGYSAVFGTYTSFTPSAMVEINSTARGFLTPRMTAAQRLAISNPAQGLIVYDTGSVTEGLWYYNSGSNPGWQQVLTNSGSQSISGSITANNITVTGTLTAQTIVAQTITSSTDYVSGSTIFGNSLNNTHQFTGSISITGSLTLPYLSTGSVLFAGATDNIAEDNTNLFWDNTNKRLGIGTNAPVNNLHISQNVNGSLYARISNPSSGNQALAGFYITNNLNVGAAFYITSNAYTGAPANAATFITDGSITGGITFSTSNANAPISFAAGSNVEKMRLYTTGNLVLQNGGTFTDSGERLQVSGSSRFIGNMVITGSSNTSATNALTIQNSVGVNAIRVRNDGSTILGQTTVHTGNAPNSAQVDTIYVNSLRGSDGASGLYVNGGSSFSIFSFQANNNGAYLSLSGQYPLYLTQTRYGINIGDTLNADAITATYTGLNISSIVNQVSGASGIIRGIRISPTLNSAWDYRSIEWTNNASATSGSWGLYGSGTAPNFLSGSLGIGTIPSTILHVNGTSTLSGSVRFGSSNGVNAGTWVDSNGTIGVIRSINGVTNGLRVYNGAGWIGHNAIEAIAYQYPIYGAQGSNGSAAASPLNAGAGVFGNGGVGVHGSGTTPSGDTGSIGVMASTLFVNNASNTALYDRNASAHIVGNNQAVLKVDSGAASNILFVSSSGNVGIGTTSPAYILDVNGNVRVSTIYFNGVPTSGNIGATGASLEFNTANSFGVYNFNCNGGGRRVSINGTASDTVGNNLLSIPFIVQNTTGTNRDFAMLNINPTVNNTLSYTGSVRGLYYNPTVISLTGTRHISIETTSGDVVLNGGNVLIGTTSNSGERLQVSGSSRFQGNMTVSGSLNVGNTNIEFQENTNVTSGSWRVVSSEPTASYKAAFFDYVMFSGSIARAGTVYSVWSASYAEFYENYTGDVGGSTSGVTLQAAISGSNIQLQATASNSSWTIRSLVRML